MPAQMSQNASVSIRVVLPDFLNESETWTVSGDSRRRLNTSSTNCLPRIMTHHEVDFMLDPRSLLETEIMLITFKIRGGQLM